jgi:hypothetical protein
MTVVTVGQAVAPYRYEDYRDAGRALLQRTRPGDAVVFADPTVGLGMRFYLPAVRRAGEVLPRDVLALPGRWVGFAPARLTEAAARRVLSSYARTWLVDYSRSGRRPPAVLAGDVCRPAFSRFAMRVELCRPAR